MLTLDQLRHACGSTAWVRLMQGMPRDANPHAAADAAFDRLTDNDWLEAFRAHPRIGDNPERHREQAQVADAEAAIRRELAELNRRYAERFGHIFITCATGKSAETMLAELRTRLNHDPATELHTAAAEQRRITHLRLDQILDQLPR